MTKSTRCFSLLAATALALTLAACGGGSSDNSPASTSPSAATQQLMLLGGAPQFTGNTATDGFNWFNFRRQQIGIPADLKLKWNPQIVLAAQRHADYQRLNGTPTTPIMHEEISGAPGFSGKYEIDRMIAAGYTLSSGDIVGEVISYMNDPSGFVAAENLITAIYHRFVIFEPMFRDAGAGFAKGSTGGTILNVNFGTSNGLGTGLASGNVELYPYANQQQVPTSFDHRTEHPDPLPETTEKTVGYPISIQTNITECITTTSFTVRSHSGGTPLPTRLLTYDADIRPVSDPDPHPTPLSAAAIVPLSPLATNTQYDVSFTGNISAPKDPFQPSLGCVGGTTFTHEWSFTTQ